MLVFIACVRKRKSIGCMKRIQNSKRNKKQKLTCCSAPQFEILLHIFIKEIFRTTCGRSTSITNDRKLELGSVHTSHRTM